MVLSFALLILWVSANDVVALVVSPCLLLLRLEERLVGGVLLLGFLLGSLLSFATDCSFAVLVLEDPVVVLEVFDEKDEARM